MVDKQIFASIQITGYNSYNPSAMHITDANKAILTIEVGKDDTNSSNVMIDTMIVESSKSCYERHICSVDIFVKTWEMLRKVLLGEIKKAVPHQQIPHILLSSTAYLSVIFERPVEIFFGGVGYTVANIPMPYQNIAFLCHYMANNSNSSYFTAAISDISDDAIKKFDKDLSKSLKMRFGTNRREPMEAAAMVVPIIAAMRNS